MPSFFLTVKQIHNIFYLCRPKDMQEIVLESELGLSKLMDILSDSRDFVRNEVGTLI